MAVISGGDKLAKALAQIASKAKGNLKVGFFSNEKYPDTGASVAQVAFWNEYGHGGNFPSPPRPFFRSMISAESGTWAPKLAAQLSGNGGDGKRALSALGEDIAGALKDSIQSFNEVPLSDTTLMLRKHYWTNRDEINKTAVLDAQQRVRDGEVGATGEQAKPLVWTGQLLRDVEFEVSE